MGKAYLYMFENNKFSSLQLVPSERGFNKVDESNPSAVAEGYEFASVSPDFDYSTYPSIPKSFFDHEYNDLFTSFKNGEADSYYVNNSKKITSPFLLDLLNAPSDMKSWTELWYATYGNNGVLFRLNDKQRITHYHLNYHIDKSQFTAWIVSLLRYAPLSSVYDSLIAFHEALPTYKPEEFAEYETLSGMLRFNTLTSEWDRLDVLIV